MFCREHHQRKNRKLHGHNFGKCIFIYIINYLIKQDIYKILYKIIYIKSTKIYKVNFQNINNYLIIIFLHNINNQFY